MIKKFIVTDPCYIILRRTYHSLGKMYDWDFEQRLKMPFIVPYEVDERDITLHTIVGTGGDGSTQYNGEWVGVDSGMLCIAENENGWESEEFGARFETKEEAEEGLKKILKEWR